MFVSPTVVGGAVIIGSCAGAVYALDRVTGALVWRHDTTADGPRAQFHGEPLLLGDRIVIPSDADPEAHLYSFDPASGRVFWKAPFDSGIATTPLRIGDRIVVVSAKGEVAALDARSGKVLWQVTPAGALQTIPYVPSPARAGDRIVVVDNTNQILALDASSGTTVWRTTLSGRPNTTPIVVEGDVVVGTFDGFLNRVSVKSGEVTKRTRLGGTPYGSPVLSDGLLFVLAKGGPSTLLALDCATHVVRWQQETPEEWTTYRPLITGSSIVVGNADEELCAFDRDSGARRWCRPVGEVPRGLGVGSDGILYVGSLSGVVQAIRLDRVGSAIQR